MVEDSPPGIENEERLTPGHNRRSLNRIQYLAMRRAASASPARPAGNGAETGQPGNTGEGLYRILAETASEAVCLYAPDGTILHANSAAGRQFGLSAAAMIGKQQADLFSPALAARRTAAIRRVARTGKPSAAEESDAADADRRVLRTETILIPVRGSDGSIRSVMGIARDVSERRRFEQALRDSEAKYRALFENNMAGVLVYDLQHDAGGALSDAVIADANPAAAAITGLPLHKLAGRRITEFGRQAPRQILAAFASVDAHARPAAFDVHSDFLDRHFSCFAYPVVPGRVALMFVDITSRKQVEEQMEDYRKQLLKLAAENAMAEERERRRIAVALHDGVGQSLVLCKMQIEESRAAVDAPIAVTRLTSAIEAIEAAIQDTRSLTFRLSPPVLHELGLVAAVEWLAENIERNHGLRVRVQTRGNPEPEDSTVRIMLFQGVRELLVNALKHAAASSVSIRIAGGKGNVTCVVEDDGKGFDARHRGPGSPRRDGMGLFNIRERFQLIGGNLKLSSRPGRGTAAQLTAPRRLQTGPATGEKDPYEKTSNRAL